MAESQNAFAVDVDTTVFCSNCENWLETPLTLPGCGHSFCKNCVQIECSSQVENAVYLTCPQCASESVLPEGSYEPKENIQLKKFVSAVKNSCDIRNDAWTWEVECVHSVLQQSHEICSHCGSKFCSDCLMRHMEFVRSEVLGIGSGFENRWQDVSSWLLSSVDTLNDAINATVACAEERIEKDCAELENEFRRIVNARKQRLRSKVAEKANQKRADLQRLVATVSSTNHKLLFEKLDTLNEESILHCTNEEISKAHSDMLAADQLAISVENLRKKPQATFGLAAGLNKTVLKKFNKDTGEDFILWLDYQGDKKLPGILSKLFYDVSADKSTAVRSTLESLPGKCRRQVVEYYYPESGTILTKAVERRNLGLVRYLVTEQGANIKTWKHDNLWSLPVHVAAEIGCLAIVKFLIDFCPDMLEATDGGLNTTLCRAVMGGMLHIVRYLVDDKGLDVKQQNLLHLAVRKSNLEVIKYLVEHGADPFEFEDDQGKLPIHYAVESGKCDVVAYLVETFPALMFTPSSQGEFPVHLAAKSGRLSVLKFLFEVSRENLETKSDAGMTPLVSAVIGRSINAVKWLLDAGANPNVTYSIKNVSEITTLHSAALLDLDGVVEALLKNCPDLINRKDSRGYTALSWAKAKNSEKAVRSLERWLATH